MVILVVLIDKPDVADPVIAPADEAGKVAVPLKVNVLPFRLNVPVVCVNAPETVKALPITKV